MIKISSFIICIFMVFIGTAMTDAAFISSYDVETISENNDDFVNDANPNYSLYFEREYSDWGEDWDGNAISYNYAYTIQESGGTTEYLFNRTIINNSGYDWIGYKFWLSIGMGDEIRQSESNDGLDFDTPVETESPVPTSSLPLSLSHNEDMLIWSGDISNEASVDFTFSIDIPDGLNAEQLLIYEEPIVDPSATYTAPDIEDSGDNGISIDGGCFLMTAALVE